MNEKLNVSAINILKLIPKYADFHKIVQKSKNMHSRYDFLLMFNLLLKYFTHYKENKIAHNFVLMSFLFVWKDPNIFDTLMYNLSSYRLHTYNHLFCTVAPELYVIFVEEIKPHMFVHYITDARMAVSMKQKRVYTHIEPELYAKCIFLSICYVFISLF